MEREHAGLRFEAELWSQGYRSIAGVDEVGRGALAGPVVAAAVILPPDPGRLAPLLGRVDDSKRLTPRQRLVIVDEILLVAAAAGVGRCEAEEIDRIGIVPATRVAMTAALAALKPAPDYVLIDYLSLPGLTCGQRPIVHGDAISLSIAAASIVAKVARDSWMTAQEAHYPGYGFAQHKGYGSAAHRAALRIFGPCGLHRLTFAGVAPEAAFFSGAGVEGEMGEGEARA